MNQSYFGYCHACGSSHEISESGYWFCPIEGHYVYAEWYGFSTLTEEQKLKLDTIIKEINETHV